MNFFVLIALAVGLSMDAFAVSVCTGLAIKKASLRNMLIVGLYFGLFQAGMPVIGYFAALYFADMINTFAPWIAFGLLCFLGLKMILGSFKKSEFINEEVSLGPRHMLPLAIATSIDALAVGVTFAVLKENIVPIVIATGIATFLLSAVGVKIGSIFGARFKSKAELAGGIILVLIGVNVLLEYFGVQII